MEKTTVLIVCEGQETEPNYFNQLKREEAVKKRFAIEVKRGKGKSRQQIAQFAVERKENASSNYDEVWCVMDVERPEVLEDMRHALAILTREGIYPALSNPAFEVWLLAHFEKNGKNFSDCDAVIRHLNKHWQQAFLADYDKTDERIYHRLADRMDQAIANAKWVRDHHDSGSDIIDANSSTDVDVLVDKLRTGVR